MTPKEAYAILEDMYSLELAEPEAMAVIKAALTQPSMEDELAEALEIIESGYWTSKIYGLQKAGRGVLMDIAGKALAKYGERKK